MVPLGYDTIIACQGPVCDPETGEQAEAAGTTPGNETLNLMGETLPIAGSILREDGFSSGFFVLGGETGGKKRPSESWLTKRRLIIYGVPEEVIEIEEESTNTLENIVNFMNLYLRDDPDRQFILLGTNYHIERIKLMMDLFNITWVGALGSHDVIRTAISYGNITPVVAQAIKELSILDIPVDRDPHDSTGFYSRQVGVNRKSYAERAHQEEAFMRLLLEVPSYWMTYLSRIEDDVMLRRVLRNVELLFPGYLQSIGIQHLSEGDAMAHARSVLGPIPRPNIGQWIIDEMYTGWPLETRWRLRQITQRKERFREQRGISMVGALTY